jgi:hypothetical protein
MDDTLRYLAPNDHERVSKFLAKYHTDISKMDTQLQVVKILKNSKKYIELLDKIEKMIMKQHGYNFILKNIPDVAEYSGTTTKCFVDYENILATMEKFGHVVAFDFIDRTAYVSFVNPHECHNAINNMMMGPNVLSSCFII